MIITSKITNKPYQWIRVPRTATVSYSNLFLGKVYSESSLIHSHARYNNFVVCKNCVNHKINNLDAFTMVRNPLHRFISSIHFIALRKETYNNLKDGFIPKKHNKYCEICNTMEPIDLSELKEKGSHTFFEFYKNEEIFYQFFYDNFNKNCELKTGLDLNAVFESPNTSMVSSFFQTQVYWTYHPKVKIFKYEEIHKFNSWIEENLGYDTSQLNRMNASQKKELSDVINIDFTTDKFKQLVKYLFHDDFLYFNYEFPI
jgi:hypothetical protein